MDNLWSKALVGERVQVRYAGNNLFVFSFSSVKARDWILENGPWHVLNKHLILRKWEPNLEKLSFDLSSLPIWVHLYNIPLELYSRLGLSYVASAIGTPLSMDFVTAGKSHLEYAKLCVEIGANDVIPNFVEVELKDGNKASIVVEVPWMPVRCKTCKIFGHSDKGYIKSKTSVHVKSQVWKKKKHITKETDSEPTVGGIELLQEKDALPSSKESDSSTIIKSDSSNIVDSIVVDYNHALTVYCEK
ncbi:uncharacterized protein LOC120183865 [Hibiscus syriacus]|uniref:uncharacterized protein LOC120183865 n=1 Tax=Hibiscus syriacus TaxID=106335 RepID=UPI0019207FD9|nr:uncharacterized protein LOC120183865 [Hibiscus syriacus]